MEPVTKKTVLVAEDEPFFLKLLSDRLEEQFVVQTARNGVEALARLSVSRPDCIVLDIEMPWLSGIEFLQEIRGRGVTVPVIVTTWKRRLQNQEACAHLGVSGYFIKPYDPSVVAGRVGEILDKGVGRPPEKSGVKICTPIDLALEYLRANIAGPVSIEAAARATGVSKGHLGNLFSQKLGASFTAFVNTLRVDEAKRLLRETDLRIDEVRRRTGFTTQQYFFRQFKKRTGQTPMRYRNKG